MWIDSIYNSYPCDISMSHKTLLSHVLQTGFAYWYMYVYMYLWERRPWSCNRLVLCFWRDNDFFMELLLFFQIPFGYDTLSSCIKFSIWRKATSVDKTSVLLFGNKDKQLKFKTVFIVFLLLLGEWPHHGSL